MLKIEDKVISINRGDKDQSFDFSIMADNETYTFKVGDVIKFGIYNKKALEKEAVILKEIIVDEETDKITIGLTQEETTIGDIVNKPIDFWYEIQLNENTIIGYDEEGAKIFRLYPEGSDIE